MDIRQTLLLLAVFVGSLVNVQAQWPVGLQMSSVKTAMAEDVPGTLARLQKWGVTELEGGLPRTVPLRTYQQLLRSQGLRYVGFGATFQQLRDSVEVVARNARTLGASYVVCYWIPHEEGRFAQADADRAVDVFVRAGRLLKQQKLTLCYHNHGYEFVKHGNGTLFDYLAERLPADAVQFELDLMWAKHPGQDPTALLKKYPGRFPLVHLKDRRPGTPGSVRGPALRPANVPLGQGDIGVSALLQEARRAGVKHLFIEDESLKPLEQIPQSIAFLQDWERHKDEIRLLVRADDLGMSHSANEGILDVLKTGIARSVEVMAPTPWFSEGVRSLKALPAADVGVHLTLTSEWQELRWRPLTSARSLSDSSGHFYPTTWKGTPAAPSLLDHQPDFDEAEEELRAQIERVRQVLPQQVSHLSVHMAFDLSHPRLREIVEKLADAYNLPLAAPSAAEPFPRFTGQQSTDPAEREKGFVAALEALQPGTYLLVTHPARDAAEMRALGGNDKVALTRAADAAMLTSAQVLAVIRRRGIQLIDYRSLSGKERDKKLVENR